MLLSAARRWIVPELKPASFEVERFELGPDDRLEVHGRWSGVRGRRFMRPTLTAVAGGREHRLLAVLDHKPWMAEEGEAWLAAFPWSSDAGGPLESQLTVAPGVTVPLPAPSPSARRRSGSRRTRARAAGDAGEPRGTSPDDGGSRDTRSRADADAASRAREEALLELDAVKRDRDRLRLELTDALAAGEALVAEQADVMEDEVREQLADLRAEAERERAAAAQAAQFARERDRARAERAEALGERDQARDERDAARLEAQSDARAT